MIHGTMDYALDDDRKKTHHCEACGAPIFKVNRVCRECLGARIVATRKAKKQARRLVELAQQRRDAAERTER